MRKKKNRGPLLIFVIFLLAVSLIVSGYLSHAKITELNGQKKELEDIIESNTQPVYVAITDINPGDIFYDAYTAPSEDQINVEVENITTGLEPEYYIDDSYMGKESIGYIEQGAPILKYLATEAEKIAPDDRDYEICVSNLMTNQALYDYVDVRITFPDGSDYLILSKKRINSLNLENCVWQTILNEEEILRMTSATIDAYIYPGTKIYTTRYVERTLQEEAVPNYPVKETTLELINNDPNILTKAAYTINLQARSSLEERLGIMDSVTVNSVLQGILNDESAQENVISTDEVSTETDYTEEY